MNERLSDAAMNARTENQRLLRGFRTKFISSTKFGSRFLALLDRSDVGVWRLERDEARNDRWWMNVTLPTHAAELFDIQLELQVLYTEYPHLEPRTLSLLQSRLNNMRVDPGVAIIVSADPDGPQLASRRRGDISLIMVDVTKLGEDERDVRARIAQVLTTIDHFDITNPIQDPSGFYGRKHELDTLRQSLDRGQSVGVFGLRKAGKTSLLNSLQRMRTDAGRPVVKVDISEVASADDFRLKLLTRSWQVVSADPGNAAIPRLRLLSVSGEVRFDLPEIKLYWIEDLRKIIHASIRRLELFVDEIDQAYPPRSNLPTEDSEGLFQSLTQLRGLIQDASTGDTRLVLVCAGVDPALFEQPVLAGRDNLVYKLVRLMWLSPMSRDEMAEMVRGLGRRMGVRIRDYRSIDLLFSEYGGHPLLSRKACSIAAKGRRPEDLPLELDLERIQDAVAARGENSAFQQALDVLVSFEEWFPDEAEIVELLNSSSIAEQDLAREIIREDPLVISHAVSYGICDEQFEPRIRAALR